MATITIDGQLEVDTLRGVIYFHNNRGETQMRIQGLPAPIPWVRDPESGPVFLDVAVETCAASWAPKDIEGGEKKCKQKEP